MRLDEIELLRLRVLDVIKPIRPADDISAAPKNFLFVAERTKAGRELPKYYLIYFLLVDLLKFRNLGKWEKVAWAVPIDFKGKVFTIEYRKFGVGVFVENPDLYEDHAKEISTLIKNGIKVAQPYFEWIAEQAAGNSSLNLINKGIPLFNKFQYFLSLYKEKADEAIKRKDDFKTTRLNKDGTDSFYLLSSELRRQAEWVALAAIDSFFTWTEHIFIHIGILLGKISTGKEITDLAEAKWPQKFKQTLGVDDAKTKEFFDQLIIIRRQLRNYITHGAFGKNGEAFYFHSGTGAVPLLLPHQRGRNRFTITEDLGFNDAEAIQVIEKFIDHLWSGEREPARLYIQENNMPTILTMAANGHYSQAMNSVEDMKEFLDYFGHEWDNFANMDW
ncbi:MAG: hypothetical protein P9L96_00875 [Candidatus Gygaella obscura]|nr:hypothetical protein [Candidatus Gygaella obscura]